MNMKFMSILLTESRKEDLRKKYAKKFEGGTGLDFILNIADLEDFNHKYTDWVLKNVDPESENFDDDVEYVVELIKDFDKYSNQFPKKDINQYVSLNELESVVNFVRTKNKDKELESQAKKIYEKGDFVVIQPKTEQASCKYGSNTKWCVTSKGSGHFGRYTAGRQALYFIINKAKSTSKNYSKIAIHFDDEGYMRYWDAQDSPLSQRESDIFEYAFPEIIDAIKNDYKEYAGSMTDKFLTEVFNKVGENSTESRDYLNSSYNLTTYIRGFQNNPDLGFGHSEARLSISLISDEENKLIDDYQVFITYKSKDDKTFTTSIGFSGTDEVSGEDFEDLGLEGWGIDVTYNIGRSPAETAEGVRRHIASRVLDHIINNPKLTQKIAGTSKVWRPDRFNYGYTFGKNKGFIKKLVDYLDAGTIGTKLDFLESLGKLKTKVVDGKKLYSRSGDNYVPSSQFRGQFSSFFASAKMAGILNYRKVGKDYFLVKGPNFEAFKSGELKAL
jgi:hypothetical protein